MSVAAIQRAVPGQYAAQRGWRDRAARQTSMQKSCMPSGARTQSVLITLYSGSSLPVTSRKRSAARQGRTTWIR